MPQRLTVTSTIRSGDQTRISSGGQWATRQHPRASFRRLRIYTRGARGGKKGPRRSTHLTPTQGGSGRRTWIYSGVMADFRANAI